MITFNARMIAFPAFANAKFWNQWDALILHPPKGKAESLPQGGDGLLRAHRRAGGGVAQGGARRPARRGGLRGGGNYMQRAGAAKADQVAAIGGDIPN